MFAYRLGKGGASLVVTLLLPIVTPTPFAYVYRCTPPAPLSLTRCHSPWRSFAVSSTILAGAWGASLLRLRRAYARIGASSGRPNKVLPAASSTVAHEPEGRPADVADGEPAPQQALSLALARKDSTPDGAPSPPRLLPLGVTGRGVDGPTLTASSVGLPGIANAPPAGAASTAQHSGRGMRSRDRARP